jgi:hypothetical protein
MAGDLQHLVRGPRDDNLQAPRLAVADDVQGNLFADVCFIQMAKHVAVRSNFAVIEGNYTSPFINPAFSAGESPSIELILAPFGS